MRRRDFIIVLGGAAGWPLAARAQQQPAMPVIALVTGLSSNYIRGRKPAFRQGLQDAGFVEGQNVAVEYHSVEGQSALLPGVVASLIERKVSVIVTAGGTEPAKVAKAGTTSIPIVFISATDPLSAGIVTSVNRPGGNITGVSLLNTALEAKRLGLLSEIVPGPSAIGALVDPHDPDDNLQVREIQEAAGALNRPIQIARAGDVSEFDAAFANLAQQGAGGLLVAASPFFASQRSQLVARAARYKLPTMYFQRELPDAGGLISYGPDFNAGYRQGGIYVGKILKGAEPAALPVMQSTKFELVINLKTAKALGLSIPPGILSIADDVIE